MKDKRILIVNDDGISSPGIKILYRIALSISRDVWIIAPGTEQSASSHSLTLHRPLRIRKLSSRKYAIDGSPTDCVYLGFKKILKSKLPDLVLSGINYGGNLGEDLSYSGTVAAAMEASLSGVLGIALSQEYADGKEINWKTAEKWAPRIIKKIVQDDWSSKVVFNVNFPDITYAKVKGIQVTCQGQHHARDLYNERVDPRGRKYYWIGASERALKKGKLGTDVRAVYDNYISITPIDMNLTNKNIINKMKKSFR